ncbi:MAG: type II secretion system protein [Firmicutes bacterium]|nr:type II secretion system protein [Bacillota bacterium]
MRCSWFTKRVISERGFTLLEVLLVASIAVVVIGGFYAALEQGWFSQRKAFDVERAQSAAGRALREIIEGAPDGSVPGLIAARAVACGISALAYAAGGREVSYYLSGGTLCRVVAPEEGNLEIRTSGGGPVAEGITSFEAADDDKLVSLAVGAAGEKGTAELARVATKVRPRNRQAASGAAGPPAAASIVTLSAEPVGAWAAPRDRAVGTVRVEALLDLGGLTWVEVSVRYRRQGQQDWTYTAWEGTGLPSYSKDIFRADWVAGETYLFEAVARFGSPYQYAYGGQIPVRIEAAPPGLEPGPPLPPGAEPGPPPPPGQQER